MGARAPPPLSAAQDFILGMTIIQPLSLYTKHPLNAISNFFLLTQQSTCKVVDEYQLNAELVRAELKRGVQAPLSDGVG